jgi:hypothetical protein
MGDFSLGPQVAFPLFQNFFLLSWTGQVRLGGLILTTSLEALSPNTVTF